MDADLAEAHALLAEVLCLYDWDHAEADKLHRRSLALDPRSPFVHRSFALHLSHMGRFEESITHINTAIDLDPNSAFDHQNLGMLLYFARRYDEAIEQLERTKEMFPDNFQTFTWLSSSYRQKGESQKTFDNFLLTPEGKKANAETKAAWQNAFDESGWDGVVKLRLEPAMRDKEWSPTGVAGMAVSLGDTDLAITQLEEACNRRIWSAVWINVNPVFDPIRSDPRFQALVRRVNLN